MGDSSQYAATIEGIREAAVRIEQHAHHTPVMTCSAADAAAGRQLFFKCETFQRTGAFKFRGACNSVQQLSDEQAAKGAPVKSFEHLVQLIFPCMLLHSVLASWKKPRQ